MIQEKPEHLDILVGARAISRYLFGTETKAAAIYPLRQQLGCFYLGGRIAARRAKLREIIENKEEAAAKATAA